MAGIIITVIELIFGAVISVDWTWIVQEPQEVENPSDNWILSLQDGSDRQARASELVFPSDVGWFC